MTATADQIIRELRARASARHSGEVSETAKLCARAADALDACMAGGASVRERLAALQADFNDCNSERARWKAKAEALK